MKILTGLLILAASLQPYVVWADAAAGAAAAAAASASNGDDAATATAVATATATATASNPVSAHIPCCCEDIYLPVCGSDGKTYSNECVLRCTSDHRVENNLSPIYVLRQGECTHIPCRCSRGGRPLCGSDGINYANECYFDCENRRRELNGLCHINVAYPGVCKLPTCICSDVIIPVCGTDGRTYRNVCLLQCVSRRSQANGGPAIGVKRPGVCPRENCICPLHIDPVCANDGNTYSNLCLLQCENRRRYQLGKRPLRVQYKGECIDCHCPKIYAPVCASNGVTFANTCPLDCENEIRKQKELPPLSIKSFGVCPCVCTLEYGPVCGTDERTYGNQCLLRCEQRRRYDLGLPQIGFKHRGRCVCNCWYCPRNYEPVCGSDGRTYWNICWLRCNRGCRNDIGYRLFVVNDGPC